MNNKFDELSKSLAQSVSRRQAFKKFGVGLAGMALACFGLANKAEAGRGNCLPAGWGCGAQGGFPRSPVLDREKAPGVCGRCCNGYICDAFTGFCNCT